MIDLVFCTNNKHKLEEVSQIMGPSFTFLRLEDIAYNNEIPEPYNTLEENSLTKANQVFEAKGVNCFAEDTGLFIEALHGEPGVLSARYSGEHATSEENIVKVLQGMSESDNRKAYFKTVITLILNGEVKQFSGICEGRIATEKSGIAGFGYDPIFIADGQTKCFAEISPEEKNAISHRRKAFDLLNDYLQTYL